MDIHRGEHAVIGVRQSLKVIAGDGAQKAFVARDVDEIIAQPVLQMCREHGVEVEFVDTKKQLGKLCNIDVGASIVVIKKS